MKHLITRLAGLLIWIIYTTFVIVVYTNDEVGSTWIPWPIAIPTIFLSIALIVWALFAIITGRLFSLLKDLWNLLRN